MSEFLFGIYPGSQAAGASGPPDNTDSIQHAIDLIQATKPILVREYIHFGNETEHDFCALTLSDAFYKRSNIRLDLVLCYLPQKEDTDGWLNFISRAIERYKHILYSLQITLEPNFDIPGIDGSSPGVRLALTQGVSHARKIVGTSSTGGIQIGFSVAEPQEWNGGDGDFWPDLWRLGGSDFIESIDYVGLALYPDAFSSVEPIGQSGDIPSLIEHALKTLKETSFPQAHIPDTLPIRIVETGSPTDVRDEKAQAESLEHIVATIFKLRTQFNVTALEWFSLRDADSSMETPQHRFGLLYDDYTPKQAFWNYKELIEQLSGELSV